MPARSGQVGVALRAEKIASSGWETLGEDGEVYERVGSILRRREPLGPDLPPSPPGGGSWLMGAVEWYEAFRVSPQAELISTDVEWLSVQQAAGLYNVFLETANVRFWTQFESLAGKLAVTPLDRRKVRARIAEEQRTETAEEQAVAEEAAAFDEEFERLTGLAAG